MDRTYSHESIGVDTDSSSCASRDTQATRNYLIIYFDYLYVTNTSASPLCLY